MNNGAVFARERNRFHAHLREALVLTMSSAGIASNADAGQEASRAYGRGIATALGAPLRRKKLAGQSSGKRFEDACADFLRGTFLELGHLRPGPWEIERIPGNEIRKGIARFEQYRHLLELDDAVTANRSLQAIVGNGYRIAPDVVVFRKPVPDDYINHSKVLVDESVATGSVMRLRNHRLPLLHAVVSCKWTLRSDRAQNARSEALDLIRNRKGRLPHVVVVTGEPTPNRISSLALGTGDVDCVYHFALPELVRSVTEAGGQADSDLLSTMISGQRLKDIADLPLDLAV